MRHRVSLLAVSLLTVAACADSTDDACEAPPWDTGEDAWVCASIVHDCSVSPCDCATCCPVSWYAVDPASDTPRWGFPQLPGEVVLVTSDEALPDVFTAHWEETRASSAEAPCAADAEVACGIPASEVVLTRDGAADVHVVLSLPATELALLAPTEPVEVRLRRGWTVASGEGGVSGVEVIGADGRLLFAAHDWREQSPPAPLPYALPGTTATLDRAAAFYCKTLPDYCNRVFETHLLTVVDGAQTVAVAPEETVEVTLAGHAYGVRNARVVTRAALGGCTDAWPDFVSFSVVRRPD